MRLGGNGDVKGAMPYMMGNTGLTHNQSWDHNKMHETLLGQVGLGIDEVHVDMGQSHVNVAWVTAVTQS